MLNVIARPSQKHSDRLQERRKSPTYRHRQLRHSDNVQEFHMMEHMAVFWYVKRNRDA